MSSNVSSASFSFFKGRMMEEIAGQSKPGLGLHEYGRAYAQVKLSEVPEKYRPIVAEAAAQDPSMISGGVVDTAKLEQFVDRMSDAFEHADEKQGGFLGFGGKYDLKISTDEAQKVFKAFGPASRDFYNAAGADNAMAPHNPRLSPEEIARNEALAHPAAVDVHAPKGTPLTKVPTAQVWSTNEQMQYARLNPQSGGRAMVNFAGGMSLGLSGLAKGAAWSHGDLAITPGAGGYDTLKLYVPAGTQLKGLSANPGFEVTSPALPPPEGAEAGGKWLYLRATSALKPGVPNGVAGDSMKFEISLPGSSFPTTDFSLTAMALGH